MLSSWALVGIVSGFSVMMLADVLGKSTSSLASDPLRYKAHFETYVELMVELSLWPWQRTSMSSITASLGISEKSNEYSA